MIKVLIKKRKLGHEHIQRKDHVKREKVAISKPGREALEDTYPVNALT